MRMIDSWREKRRRELAYRQISSFSDHILSDIGISRSALEDLLRGRGYPSR